MIANELATRASAAGFVSLDDPVCEAPALAGNKAASLAVLRGVPARLTRRAGRRVQRCERGGGRWRRG